MLENLVLDAEVQGPVWGPVPVCMTVAATGKPQPPAVVAEGPFSSFWAESEACWRR